MRGHSRVDPSEQSLNFTLVALVIVSLLAAGSELILPNVYCPVS